MTAIEVLAAFAEGIKAQEARRSKIGVDPFKREDLTKIAKRLFDEECKRSNVFAAVQGIINKQAALPVETFGLVEGIVGSMVQNGGLKKEVADELMLAFEVGSLPKDPNGVDKDGSIGWEFFARRSGFSGAKQASDTEFREIDWTVEHSGSLPRQFFDNEIWWLDEKNKRVCKCGLQVLACGACGLGTSQAWINSK